MTIDRFYRFQQEAWNRQRVLASKAEARFIPRETAEEHMRAQFPIHKPRKFTKREIARMLAREKKYKEKIKSLTCPCCGHVAEED